MNRRFGLAVLLIICTIGCARPDGTPHEGEQASVFDPTAMGWGSAADPADLPPVEVLDYGPRGAAESAWNVGQVRVRFSRPVVPVTSAEGQAADGVLVVSDHEGRVEGESYFKTPDLLVWESKGALPPAHEYSVELRPFEGTDGETVEIDLQWTFESGRPSVVLREPYSGASDARRTPQILLTTTMDTEVDELRDLVGLTVDGKAVEVEVDDVDEADFRWLPAHHALFRVSAVDDFPLGAKVEIDVEPGWRSTAGPLPANEHYRDSFRVHPALGVESVDCGSEQVCDIRPVAVEFSTPLLAEEVKHIRVRPEPPNFEIDTFGSQEFNQVWLRGNFLPNIDYELIVDGRIEDVFGQTLGDTFRHEFRFEMPPAQLYLDQRFGTVIDDGEARIGVSSRHVEEFRVRVARVPVEKYRQLLGRSEGASWNSALENLGEVAERTFRTKFLQPTEWASTPVELSEIVGDWRGPVAVEVRATQMTEGYESAALVSRGHFQFSSVAAHMFHSRARTFVRVEDLVTREPVANARVMGSFAPNDERAFGVTDRDGLLEISSRDASHGSGIGGLSRFWAEAPSGEPVVIESPLSKPYETGLRPGESVHGQALTERGVYRPGETVYAFGWSAVRTPHDPHGFREIPPETLAVMKLVDRSGTEIASAERPVRHGKFDVSMELPKSVRLGSLTLRVKFERDGVELPGALSYIAEVEEYRVPDFLVEATVDDRVLAGDQSTNLNVAARYYTGSPAEIANLRVRRHCRYVSPPDREGWSIGRPPRWGGLGVAHPKAGHPTNGHRAVVGVSGLNDPQGYTRRCRLDAVVRNASFQEEGASVSLEVHPAETYLGIGGLPEFVPPGAALKPRIGAFDLEGEPTTGTGRVEMVVERVEQKPVYKGRGKRRWVGHYDEVRTGVARCAVDLGGKEVADCPVLRLPDGTYEVLAKDADDDAIVASGDFVVVELKSQPSDQDFLEIEVSFDVLEPGDDVPVRIVSERDVSGVLFVERFGIREAKPFRTRRGVASLTLKSDETWVPTMRLRAVAIEAVDSAFALREVTADLEFSDQSRRLDVGVTAPETTSIRSKVPIEVDVSRDGEPIEGRVTVWAVDEAVLDLTNYSVPDIVKRFLPRHIGGGLAFGHLDTLLGIFSPQLYDPYSAGGYGLGSGGGSGFGAGGAGRAAGPEPPARSNMVTTPLFVGDAVVRGGKAAVSFTTPDNMTAYRIIAVASETLHDDAPMRFGNDDTLIEVRAPIVVRPALPRFVRPGDAPTLGVVLSNPSGEAGDWYVRAKADGPISLSSGAVTYQVRADGSDRALRLDFPATVKGPGLAHLEFYARLTPDSGARPYEDRVRVPVESRAERTVVETVAVYGTVDQDTPVSLPVQVPSDALAGVGGVEVSVTSTLLGGLRDATRELVEYPYGCVEQTSSRMLPLVALADLKHFVSAVEIPNGATIDSFVASGLDRLLSMQNSDGGFGYWPGGASAPYASAYVTWVMLLAEKAGHDVPPTAKRTALNYLESVVESPDRDWPDSVLYYHDVRRSIAVHALTMADREAKKAIDELYERRERLPLFSKAFLALAMHRTAPDDPRVAEMTRVMTNAITEHPGTAHVVESPRYDLGPVFHSDLRSTAIVLSALLEVRPDHPVVPKLARGLMEKRVRGAWRNTQENAYALVSLADYARVYEATEPNFVARVWTDHALLLDDVWRGRTSKAREARVPMDALVDLASKDARHRVGLNIQRRGEGRAYYRLAMRYGVDPATAPGAARGLRVERSFRRVGKPDPSSVLPLVKAGEIVAIDVEIEAKTRTRYVAIDVPLPAGLEAVNVSLGSPKALPLSGVRGWWVSHVEYHDDRVVLFADSLHPGARRHTVFVRATTPGNFVFPPTSATAMYAPEVFGRTAGSTMEVEP